MFLGILDFQKIVKIFTEKFDELSKIVETEKMKVINLKFLSNLVFYLLNFDCYSRLLDLEILLKRSKYKEKAKQLKSDICIWKKQWN